VIADPAAENLMQARILGAAFKAFMEAGYAGTSTLDIATRAKVSKRDLYAHFGSKHAMLIACIKSRAERMRLPPDLPAPRTRQMLAATLTAFATTLVRETSDQDVIATFRLAIAEATRSPEIAEALDTAGRAQRARRSPDCWRPPNQLGSSAAATRRKWRCSTLGCSGKASWWAYCSAPPSGPDGPSPSGARPRQRRRSCGSILVLPRIDTSLTPLHLLVHYYISSSIR